MKKDAPTTNLESRRRGAYDTRLMIYATFRWPATEVQCGARGTDGQGALLSKLPSGQVKDWPAIPSFNKCT
jgi:hypothetical protein